jgi:hypothetical protein
MSAIDQIPPLLGLIYAQLHYIESRMTCHPYPDLERLVGMAISGVSTYFLFKTWGWL